MADQIMKASAELDALVPELWSANFYPTLLENLPFIDSVDRSYEGEIQSLGDQVNVSSFPEFGAAQELAEDAANDAQGITVSSTALVINKQIVQDFIVTRKAMLQSIDAVERLNSLAMFSVMKKIQALIIAESVPSAATPDHAISYDTSTTLVLADIIEIKDLLDAQDVDEMGRVAVVGSAQKNDLFNISGFTSRDYIPAGSPMTAGDISTPVLGFDIKMATGAGTTSYWFHPSYLTLAIQENPSVEVFNLGGEGKRAKRVNITSLLGVKILDNTRLATLS